MTQIQYISFILFALYFVGIMVVVLRAKKSTSAEDYFLAGRQLPFWALSITFIASWWGGGSAIDLVDQGFNQGISSFWIYGMPVLFSTFLMYLFSKAIRKIGTITQPQLMEARYNKKVAFLLSLLILIFMILGVATQVVVIGNFFQSFFDIDYKIAALVGTSVVLLYSFFGGFKGVVITDIIQFVFLLIAVVVLFIVAYQHSGGFEKVQEIALEQNKPAFFSFFHNISNNLPKPVRDQKGVDNVIIPDVNIELGYVMEAIKATKEKLNDEIPLIGFAGSPWTILCYVVQGQGSKNFDKAKEFCFTNPIAAHQLLQKITDTTIAYLKAKVMAGVNAVQIFDSWGGMLSPTDYQEFSWKYIQQIINALKDFAPVIAFGKGCWFALNEMSKSGAAALGVDWTCSARNARYLSGGNITLQGNFDPSRLMSPPAEIKKMVHQMIREFGKDKYIVNLGHGILPNIPLENAKAFIDAVKEYKD